MELLMLSETFLGLMMILCQFMLDLVEFVELIIICIAVEVDTIKMSGRVERMNGPSSEPRSTPMGQRCIWTVVFQ